MRYDLGKKDLCEGVYSSLGVKKLVSLEGKRPLTVGRSEHGAEEGRRK